MTRFQTLRSAALMGAAIWMICLGAADAAGLRASVNTNEVALGDAFQLTLRADAGATQPPDLSPLNDKFDILGTSRSSQISIINGARSNTLSWGVTIAPKDLGDVTIPSITAGAATSDPIGITVVDAASLPDSQASSDGLAVTVDIPEGAHYVHQEIPITVRIEATATLRQAALAVPEMPDVILTQTGEDRVSQVTRNGVPVAVLERDYLLRPQASGQITLEPFTLQGSLPDPNSRRRSPFANRRFDDMFNGSMFGGSMLNDMLNPGKPVAVRSEPVSLDIKGSPVTGQDGWFLPAKSVLVEAAWQPATPEFKVGEAVERRVRILALGATPEQLPDIAFDEVDGVRVYVENSDTRAVDTTDGTAAMRETVFSILPTRSGEITLPELRVDWWDTGAEEAKTATLASETIMVEPGAPGAETVAAPPSTVEQSADQSAQPAAMAENSAPDMLTILGLIAAGILAAGGVVAYRKYRATPAAPVGQAGASPSYAGAPGGADVNKLRQSEAFKRLRDACAGGDDKAIHAALSTWRLEAGLVSYDALAETHFALARQVSALEARLFGGDGKNGSDEFDATSLLTYAADVNRKLMGDRKAAARGPVLPALYPETAAPAV